MAIKFDELQLILSKRRLDRYLQAAANDKLIAVELYLANVKLSKEFFAAIGFFEVALRNKIDSCYTAHFGQNWIKDSIKKGGPFDRESTRKSANVINDKINNLGNRYEHSNLITSMDFGFWRYLFASPQFFAFGAKLLSIFIKKPGSNKDNNYNHKMVFDYLSAINSTRNRIAHHEPICFMKQRYSVIDTTLIRERYIMITSLLKWMGINSAELFSGSENVLGVCNELESIRKSLPGGS